MPTEQARRVHRHERILEAALQVFTLKGYHGTAVDEIASESGTSKGGVYFHFPNKEAIFLALLDRMAAMLRSRVEAAIAAEPSPVRKAETALRVVLHTFASHRTLARLFLVDALGAGRTFDERLAAIRASFTRLIQQQLDDAIRAGAIADAGIDTRVASQVWFGALNEVVTSWVMTEPSGRLEDAYPTLRALLLRSLGVEPELDESDNI
jgi:AcrR family transcriptional regulator